MKKIAIKTCEECPHFQKDDEHYCWHKSYAVTLPSSSMFEIPEMVPLEDDKENEK